MKLRKKVDWATHAWARKGDKKLRALQREKMKIFAAYAELTGAMDAGQVGDVTVIRFWKSQRLNNISFEEQMSFWGAIKELWMIWGKVGEPPLPRLSS